MTSRSYYSSSIQNFCKEPVETILGYLTGNNEFSELTIEQINAWKKQIPVLREQLGKVDAGHLLLEYTIPRIGKRCDAIIIYHNVILVIEFKCGSGDFKKADINQVVDYALDLKNFHEESHLRNIVPVLVSTEASSQEWELKYAHDAIAAPILSNGNNLSDIIDNLNGRGANITPGIWESSSYKPTPTIIEAARALYNQHCVEDISRNDASEINLKITSKKVADIILHSKRHNRKSICFITGVPGAGKTLAGLNIATKAKSHEFVSTFLSGNGPLVEVLQYALAKDRKEQTGCTISEAERETKAFIQNIHTFRDTYLNDPKAPVDKVVVFDEAQRAWNKEKTSRFMREKKGKLGFNQSEPDLLVSVMDRHSDWCVIVGLIGGGQEINIGEAGLTEWFKGLENYKEWDTYVSSYIDENPSYTGGKKLDAILPKNSKIEPDLHLSVGIRSFRSEKVSDFVNLLIANKPEQAKFLHSEIRDSFPFYVTRDLNAAKNWLKSKQRGTERMGIIATSSAKRLNAFGIQMKLNVEPKHWYLADDSDIRSSNFLELTASQFYVQGLELDWSIIGWDGDLRYENRSWDHNNFKGSQWQKIRKSMDQNYLENAYRVLLTRARQGSIIFIPEGDQSDCTRNNKYYDGTYNYLKSCGIEEVF